MKICFITPGPIEWASSRYRAHWVAQHIEGAHVCEINALTEGFTDFFDVVIFVKKVNGELIQVLKEQGKKVYWDICDPVWWFKPDEARKVADLVDAVVPSNTGLADDFMDFYKKPKHVKVIPDRMELAHYPEQRIHSNVNPIRFIWYGAAQNRTAIYGGFTNLDRLNANGHKVELTVYDDHPEILSQHVPDTPMYHTKWRLAMENRVISSHDIALLPPYPGPWGKVKSNNKKLTAWACGLPVSDGQDYYDMLKLVTDTEERKRRAEVGYKLLIKDYQVEQSAREWKELINA
jgi:hypothetical protein